MTPVAAAVLIADRFWRAMFLAAGIAVVSGVVGLYVSYYVDAGPGPAIVVTSTALFALTWMFRIVRQRFVPEATANRREMEQFSEPT